MKKNLLAKSILQDRPIAYHPDVARVCGGVKAGVFFSQLMYWSDKGKRGDGFIWKTQEDFEIETALTRREQDTARKQLKERGFIEEKLAGIPATLHYKIKWDVFMEKLDQHYEQTSLHKSAKLDDTEAPNLTEQNSQTIPESTSENNTENTQKTKTTVVAEKINEQTDSAIVFYENHIDGITPFSSEVIHDAVDTYTESVVIEAMKEAVKNNVRKWNYIEAILENWKKNGRKPRPQNQPIIKDETGGVYV